MKLLRELIDIPESMPASRFVLRLSEGIKDPEATIREYVVTDQLVGCFDKALAIIQQALTQKSSYGAYLHGSFGSGKSHFMAVLHLILTGHPNARAIPELAQVIARHNSWMNGKKFLLVPYHMIGRTSLEDGVLKGYCDFLAETHPGVTPPPIYRSAALIKQARQERERYGDEAFFARLNASAGGDDGWGDIDTEWTPESFEAAAAATHASDSHTALASRLQEHYQASAHVLSDYVNIDDGLSLISCHAKSLGYDGLVLFLDELMLWLAAHASDHEFLQVETAKLAKLVEAQNTNRPAPIVSFIARQRDLKELVGNVPGAQRINYGDFVQWNQDRFDMITLEDRNLPVITERRLLTPSSPGAKAEIDAAFQRTTAVRDSIRQTLLTSDGDTTMFRQVYPFTPALIKTLVAISSVLQRDRTALKVLSQLLVDHRDTLKVTDLVPVGDLFDVLVHGDTVTSSDVITHFEDAEKLYLNKLVPMLEEQHGVRLEDLEKLPVDDQRRMQFTAHDRLLKTLLLAALVPNVESLRGMTAERLAALNHGSIQTPLAGREVQILSGLLREWASKVGEIQLTGEPSNPSVSIQLSDVDTDAILRAAQPQDNYGNRVGLIKRIVFQQAFELDDTNLFDVDHSFEWRGIKRTAAVQFANVRDISHDQLNNPGSDWKLVIDFPFDKENHTARDDLSALDSFRSSRGSTNTVVWVPAFFSERTMNNLGRLVLLEYVLSSNQLEQYASHLSPAGRNQAKLILENQRNTLRGQIGSAINIAYGIETGGQQNVLANDVELDIADRFQSLASGLTLQPPAEATLGAAANDLLGQALAWEFPAAPKFETPLTSRKLESVLQIALKAAADDNGRAAVEKDDRRLMAQIANPLRIGDMPHDGTHFVIGRHWLDHFNRAAAVDGESITAEKLRRWMNDPQPMGITREAENLVILLYAAQGGMSFTLQGGPSEASLNRLEDALVLVRETPPDETAWGPAVQRAGSVFGVPVSHLRTAANAAVLGAKVKEIAAEAAADARSYTSALQERLRQLGVTESDSSRLQTGRATVSMLDAINAAAPRDIVTVLANTVIPTTEQAVGECVRGSQKWAQSLGGDFWGLVDRVKTVAAEVQQRATPILDEVRQALIHDSHVATAALHDVIATASPRLLDVLVPPVSPVAPPPPPPPAPTPEPPTPATTAARRVIPHEGKEERLSPASAAERIAAIGAAHPGDAIEITIVWKRKDA